MNNDNVTEFKPIKRTPGMQKIAPPITWGEDFIKMSIEKREERARKVASAMNHAADVLQTERNELLGVVAAQEAKIKQQHEAYMKQGELFHSTMQEENAKMQEVYVELREKQKLIGAMKKHLRELGDDTFSKLGN